MARAVPLGQNGNVETPYRKRLRRREERCHWRYLTFSCHRRLQLLGNRAIRDLLVQSIANARETCGFKLLAWVIMPEHIHMIIVSTRDEWPIPRILVAIKQPVAQTVVRRWRRLGAPVIGRITASDGRVRFWQAGGGFDRNVRDQDELTREIEYIHRNPVRRGLAKEPTDWAWSSARWYAGITEGQIPIDRDYR